MRKNLDLKKTIVSLRKQYFQTVDIVTFINNKFNGNYTAEFVDTILANVDMDEYQAFYIHFKHILHYTIRNLRTHGNVLIAVFPLDDKKKKEICDELAMFNIEVTFNEITDKKGGVDTIAYLVKDNN